MQYDPQRSRIGLLLPTPHDLRENDPLAVHVEDGGIIFSTTIAAPPLTNPITYHHPPRYEQDMIILAAMPHPMEKREIPFVYIVFQ